MESKEIFQFKKFEFSFKFKKTAMINTKIDITEYSILFHLTNFLESFPNNQIKIRNYKKEQNLFYRLIENKKPDYEIVIKIPMIKKYC
ncbi:MAG: hypothetical protein QXZ13_02000 [Candidatus Diapherotrites archaeon]